MDVRSENFQSPSASGGAGFRAFRGEDIPRPAALNTEHAEARRQWEVGWHRASFRIRRHLGCSIVWTVRLLECFIDRLCVLCVLCVRKMSHAEGAEDAEMCRGSWGARRACPRIDEGPKVPVPTGFDASSRSILSNLSDLYSHQSHQSHRTYHRRSVPSVRSVLSVPKQKTRRSALHEKRLVVSVGTDSLSFTRTF